MTMWTETAAVTDCAVAKSFPCVITVDLHDRSVWRFCPNSQCSDKETGLQGVRDEPRPSSRCGV